jgi:hypothetical protein
MSDQPGALDPVRALAQTVLYEGYVLYPYGARADKNQVRFQWGVLGPVGAEDEGACEGPHARVDGILEGDAASELTVTVRFLQVQHREVERATATGFEPVAELAVDDELLLPWDEVVEQEVRLEPVTVGRLPGRPVRQDLTVAGHEQAEELRDGDGRLVGRVVRRRWPLTGEVRLTTDAADVDGRLWRFRVAVDNRASWTPGGSRQLALRRSLVATHVAATTNAAFVSVQDPPGHARDAVATCVSHRLWPVLVGPPGTRDTLLATPIILYDHPELAPESPGDLFDATEIDELLTLRVMTLTDEEKREARATDPRAAAIVDRADDLPPEIFERLHGAIRQMRPRTWWDPTSPRTNSRPRARRPTTRRSRGGTRARTRACPRRPMRWRSRGSRWPRAAASGCAPRGARTPRICS